MIRCDLAPHIESAFQSSRARPWKSLSSVLFLGLYLTMSILVVALCLTLVKK